jgi:hypothetical protein
VSSNIKEGTIPCKSLRSKQIYFLQLVRKHASLANLYCPECRRKTGFKWHGFRELNVEVDERFVGTDRVALLKPQPRTSWERASARLTPCLLSGLRSRRSLPGRRPRRPGRREVPENSGRSRPRAERSYRCSGKFRPRPLIGATDDTTKACAAYHNFLTLGKDADPAIPILRQAKREYVELR